VGKPLHILVAEDNALNQKMLTTLLKKWQHFVFVVGNGAEAVDFLTHQPCDLVFMDVQMPVMDGYDATRAIRAKEMQSGHHTPIIAFTAHAMKGDRERCLAAGMDDYLSKPVSVEQVGAILKRFCAADGIGLPRDEWADVKS
jgi:CheY-like chemotaxis protein